MRHLTNVFRDIKEDHGYLTAEIVEEMLRDHNNETRLLSVLVRFRDARCLCAIQYLDTFIKWAENSGSYVRDVSIPSGCDDWMHVGYVPHNEEEW